MWSWFSGYKRPARKSWWGQERHLVGTRGRQSDHYTNQHLIRKASGIYFFAQAANHV